MIEGRGIAGLVTGLGIAQIVSWGSLYYSISVLGVPMRTGTGVSELFLYGAYTAGLLVSGVLSPMAGRLIDSKGGRTVLAAGSIAGAAAMALLALASGGAMLVAGWIVAGIAMSATLYDPAFATLSQHTGERYRRAVTLLTLLGGLASTVFWPLALVLNEAWGWRAAFAVFAVLHLALCLPIHLFVVPPRPAEARTRESRERSGERSPAFGNPRLAWLNASFGLVTFAVGVIAVRMVELLTGVGLTPAQAVAASTLMGPMQVAGRVLEMGFLARTRATSVGIASMLLIVVAVGLLANAAGSPALAVAFVVSYGCGNGIYTIVRGAAPAELFGPAGLGELLGHLARPSLFARALAPGAYSVVTAIGVGQSAAMGLLAAILVAGLACFALAVRPSYGG